MIKYISLFLPSKQTNSPLVLIGFFLYLFGLLALLISVWHGAAETSGLWLWLWMSSLAVLLFAVRWPQLGILTYILITYSVPRYTEPFYVLTSLSLPECTAYMALAAFLLWVLSNKIQFRISDPLVWVMIGLWITLILSAINAVVRGLPWDPLNEDPMGQLNQMLILFFLGVSVLANRSGVILLAGTIFLALAVRVGFGGMVNLQGDHDIAFLIVTFLPFLLLVALLTPNSRVSGLTMLLFAAPLLYALSQTHNRGAVVGLLGVSMILWLRSRRKLLGALIGVLLFAGLYFSGSMQIYFQRFASMLTGQSVEGRLNVWQAGLRMVYENPVLGVGLGNFQSQSLLYGENPVMGALVAHNNFLHIAGEGGVLALTLYALLIVGAFIRCAQLCSARIQWQRTIGRIIEASLVGYVMAGMFLSRHNFAFAYLIVGIAVGIFSSIEKEKNFIARVS